MKALQINDLPIIQSNLTEEEQLKKALKVFADTKKAKIFISKSNDDFYSREKIVIVWDQPHSIFGKTFTTKYFEMNKPGILQWGHDNGTILLSKE